MRQGEFPEPEREAPLLRRGALLPQFPPEAPDQGPSVFSPIGFVRLAGGCSPTSSATLRSRRGRRRSRRARARGRPRARPPRRGRSRACRPGRRGAARAPSRGGPRRPRRRGPRGGRSRGRAPRARARAPPRRGRRRRARARGTRPRVGRIITASASTGGPSPVQRSGSVVAPRIPSIAWSSAIAFAPCALRLARGRGGVTRTMIAIPSPSEIRWLRRRDPVTRGANLRRLDTDRVPDGLELEERRDLLEALRVGGRRGRPASRSRRRRARGRRGGRRRR